MSSIRQVLDGDIAALEDIVKIMADPLESQKFSVVDQGLNISAKYIWVMKAIPTTNVTAFIGNNAATVRRFFNETVEFVTTGKRRPIRVESWDGIIRDIATQYDIEQQQVGNIGALSVSRSVERRGLTAMRVGHVDLDHSLSTMADDDIICKWIVREDGVYDMLRSIVLLMAIYKRYCPNADGSSGITVSQAPPPDPIFAQ